MPQLYAVKQVTGRHPRRARRRITTMKHFVSTSLGTVAVRIHPGTSSQAVRPGPPPWVFLHGASGSWRTFRAPAISTAFPAESDRVFVDLPGWGDSKGRLPFTVEEQGSAVVEVLSSLGYRTWSLFGHSMGAVLALEIAAACPEETHAVIALSPTALTAGAALNQPLRHPTMAPLVGMYGLMSILRALGRTGPALLRVTERTGLLRLILRPLFARPSTMQRQVFADLATDARPASFLAAASALRKYDVGMWRSITAPTVLARGVHDLFTPPSELRGVATLIPHARIAELPGTGHFPHIEDPVGIARLLVALRPAAQPLNGLD